VGLVQAYHVKGGETHSGVGGGGEFLVLAVGRTGGWSERRGFQCQRANGVSEVSEKFVSPGGRKPGEEGGCAALRGHQQESKPKGKEVGGGGEKYRSFLKSRARLSRE